MTDEFGRRFALLTDYAHKQGNKRSIHIVCLIVLMSGRHFRITGAFTDVIGAPVGIAGCFAPAFSFRLSGFSIAQVGAAAAGAAIPKRTGLVKTSKQCAPHHHPPGGGSGVVTCSVCWFFCLSTCLILANYY